MAFFSPSVETRIGKKSTAFVVFPFSLFSFFLSFFFFLFFLFFFVFCSPAAGDYCAIVAHCRKKLPSRNCVSYRGEILADDRPPAIGAERELKTNIRTLSGLLETRIVYVV